MERVPIHKPEVGNNLTVPVHPGCTYVFTYLPEDIVWDRTGDDLHAVFADGALLVLQKFFLAGMNKEVYLQFYDVVVLARDLVGAFAADLQTDACGENLCDIRQAHYTDAAQAEQEADLFALHESPLDALTAVTISTPSERAEMPLGALFRAAGQVLSEASVEKSLAAEPGAAAGGVFGLCAHQDFEAIAGTVSHTTGVGFLLHDSGYAAIREGALLFDGGACGALLPGGEHWLDRLEEVSQRLLEHTPDKLIGNPQSSDLTTILLNHIFYETLQNY